jgi:hypothetical protein
VWTVEVASSMLLGDIKLSEQRHLLDNSRAVLRGFSFACATQQPPFHRVAENRALFELKQCFWKSLLDASTRFIYAANVDRTVNQKFTLYCVPRRIRVAPRTTVAVQ